MAEALRGKEGTYVEGRTGWRKFAEVVTASLFLVVVTLGFVLVGARGKLVGCYFLFIIMVEVNSRYS